MNQKATLDNLQGTYEISYQSIPQIEGWYEPGVGVANIIDTNLSGIDGAGVKWDATLEISDDGTIKFKACLDPTNAAPNAGLMNNFGEMTRTKQFYEGIIKATIHGTITILRTEVQQGPVTINVQFRKR